MTVKDRAACYSDLYACFVNGLCHPRAELLTPDYYRNIEQLASILGLDFQGELDALAQIVDEGVPNLKTLRLEHSRLFIGPFSLEAPPYESYYLEKGIVMGESTLEVEQIYSRAGFIISEEFKDAPDHIVLEANFLSEICALEYHALAEGNSEDALSYHRQACYFLQEHLLQWLNEFYSRVRENAESSFYPAVLGMLLKTAVVQLELKI